MRKAAAAALCALAACGRLGFDGVAVDAGAGSDADSGMGGALVPLALPEGGQLRRVVVAPSDNSWYVYSVSGRLFRILSGEPAFHPCGATDPNFTLTGVSLVGDTVYATGDATYMSTDHCATWTEVPVGRSTFGMADVGGAAVAMTDLDLRMDAGATWSPIAGPPVAQYRYFSSRGGGTPLYMFGTHTGPGVVATTNGVTFSSTATNFLSANTAGVAAGATKTYAITEPNGTNVSDIVVGNATATTFTSNYDVGGTAIAVDPGDTNHVVAAVFDNLAETFDGFATAPMEGLRGPTNLPDAIIFGITFTQDRQVLIANNRGLYRSAPGGLSFTADHLGITAWEANTIVRDGNDVLIPTDGGLLVSRNGAAFDLHESGTQINTAFSSVIALANGELWGTGRGVWRSTDRGMSWTHPLLYDNPDGYYAFSIAEHAGTIFVGTRTALRYATAPYATWTTRALPGGADNVIALFTLGNEVWVGTNSGTLYKTVDDGATLTALPGTTDNIYTLGALPDGRLLVGTITGLLVSDPTRSTVTMVPGISAGVHSIFVDGNEVVLGTDFGITVSRDAGLTWNKIAATTGLDVRGAVLDPGDRSIIYSAWGHDLARVALP